MPIDFVSLLVSAAIRAFGLGVAAFVGLSLLRIRSSAARHATWTVVLAGMLLQIPFELVAPTVPLRVLPAPEQTPAIVSSARVSIGASQTLTPASHMRREPKRISWRETLAGVYLAISMLLLVRMALGYWGLRRVLRDARPVPNLGPEIFDSASFVVPGSVGGFRARILLPSVWRDWDTVKLQAVLSHERAHIRRHDWLILVASQVNVCIFWFHPLAWWMEHELSRLAEEACDDVAVSQMEDREDYAAALVDIARAAAAGDGIVNWRVISMAKDSNVVRRVNRILDRGLQIPKPLGRLAWVMLFACGLPVIYLSAAAKLSSVNREATVLEHTAAMLPEQNLPVTLMAQAAPNQPVRPAPPLIPSQPQDQPITMCILIDNSGSMSDKQAEVKSAALALVRESKPRDEVCIVDFSDEVFLDLTFTSDITKMGEAIAHYESRGGKAMRDAILGSIDYVEQKAHNDRKVLVLVTEGNDSSSTATQEQLLGAVKGSGVPIYVIGLLSEKFPVRAEAAKLALGQLAQASRGLVEYPKDLADVESISAEIANKIRRQ